LLVAFGCVLGTYWPGAQALGIGGGIPALLAPLTWLRLGTWPFVHADSAHLASNMMFFLLLSPGLEEKQGALEYGFCLLLTALVIGLAHLVFGSSGTVLVGASGWVFMMIILATFTTGAERTVSVPTLLVAVLYGWQELRAAFTPNAVSHFAHLLGGACGLAFGLLGSGRRAESPDHPVVPASPA
jgi:membrane associated rhomboid family serine protease